MAARAPERSVGRWRVPVCADDRFKNELAFVLELKLCGGNFGSEQIWAGEELRGARGLVGTPPARTDGFGCKPNAETVERLLEEFYHALKFAARPSFAGAQDAVALPDFFAGRDKFIR